MAEELTGRVGAKIEKAQDELGDLVAAAVHKVQVEQLSRTTDHLDRKDDQLDDYDYRGHPRARAAADGPDTREH